MLKTLYRWALLGLAIVLATIASSWLGATWYVSQYPAIAEYLRPLTVLDSDDGRVIKEARRGQWVIIDTLVRRQPYSCWGTFTYVIDGPTRYQFPVLRAQDLDAQVHEFQVHHLMHLPEGLPPGDYAWKVIVYPSCHGVDTHPVTIDLHSTLKITKAP